VIVVLGDLIADFNLRIPAFPVIAGDMARADYLSLGPGGATNIAIVAARLGIDVACLGEIGDDRFGQIILDGLMLEGIETDQIQVSAGGETPVAGVLIDAHGEPAYIGYRGHLMVDRLLSTWQQTIQASAGLFVDGWQDQEQQDRIITAGLRAATDAGVPTFFDPGPGNPEFDLDWHREAIGMTTVLLATESEASRLSGLPDPIASAEALLREGPKLVVMKRGVAGCVLFSRQATEIAAGLPVEALDATGAGDSLDAAVIYGWLLRYDLESIGALANAAGAAKVRKLGTGHNVPTKAEIQDVLHEFTPEFGPLLE
jgi:sugar/nucleoside kinase (ribokinase family)